ncbi:MAG: DUF1501 domain-containing protein [Tepidisphaerales bacterium]
MNNIIPSRRDMLRIGALTFGGFSLAELLQMQALGQTTRPTTQPTTRPVVIKAKAKAVIQLWMAGGPPHTDTFDPKPESGEEYCGPLRKPIATNVPGIRIGELLPLLAKQADKYSIIRSYTHGNDGHETATYIVQTGTMPSKDLVYPSMGAVLAYKRQTEGGYKSVLPPYICVTHALGRFSEAGFLGPNYQAYSTGGDPAAKEFSPQGLAPPKGVSEQRINERRSMLEAVDTLGREMGKEGAIGEMNEFQQRGYELLLGQARKAFDMSAETPELRAKYGQHKFGQSCLLARRLVENGVPFITVHYGGWDTHKDHFPAMKTLLPTLDSGFSALLEDLAQRGLLDSTIVMWTGEFGRTPKIANEPPWYGGRHHYGKVFSTVVAGGGFKGGQVVGSSDARGETVKDRPVYPWDLSATMYRLLGIDPDSRLPHPQGCVARVTPAPGPEYKSGGLLTEIV